MKSWILLYAISAAISVNNSIGSIISQEAKIPHHQNFLIVFQNFKSRKLKWQIRWKVLMM